MEAITHYYNWIINDLGDPRVNDWILAKPWTVTSTILLYIYLIKIGLPSWMNNRSAYDLKKIIQAYNLILLTFNIGIVYRGLTLNLFHMGCEIPSFSTDPMSMKQLNWIWCTLLVKLVELIETIFYILRKKPKQASFLHIYHHAFVIVFMWLGLKYFGGGTAGLPVIVNSSVHVLMYSYYYLASISNTETRKKILKFKKALTMVQMVQFIFVIFHVVKNKYDGCELPTILVAMFIPFVFSIFLLFVDFFKTSYGPKTTEQFQKTTKMM